METAVVELQLIAEDELAVLKGLYFELSGVTMQLKNEERSYGNEKLQVETEEQGASNSEARVFISQQLEEESVWLRFWRWTGIGEKTLLDLMQLVVAIAASIAIPIILAMIGYQQEQADQTRQEQAQKLAEDNQHHQILSSYLDQMTQLLLEKKLGESDLESDARFIARARTLNTLRQLDGGRKGELLKFLYEADLIGGQCGFNPISLESSGCQPPILNLGDARLDETIFERPIPLQGVDLSGSLLPEAQLQGIDLTKAEMQKVDLNGANLTKAILADVQMEGATLIQAILVDAILPRANLEGANLTNSDLRGANLEQAVLTGAELQRAMLNEATLIRANLQNAKLEGANLNGADLQGADLRGADLSEASLEGADLKGAIYDEMTTRFPLDFDRSGRGMNNQ